MVDSTAALGPSGSGASPRLSDRIFYALDLAIAQRDVRICELLLRAIELALTRNTGGLDFVERRGFPPELEDALERVSQIRDRDP
jgi:hypothetical protein